MMNNISTFSLRSIIIALFPILLFCSCERRILEEEGQIEPEQTALIPIRIDWSQSGINLQTLHRTSVWFFPQDGKGEIVEQRMEGNTSETTIQVPIGRYSILVFNETVDEGDWTNMSFKGCDKFNTFSAFAREDKRELLASKGMKSSTSAFHLTPEPLASWMLADFEVTPDMVAITRSRATQGYTTKADSRTRALEEQVDQQLAPLQTIVPQMLLIKTHIKAHISNLSSANSVIAQVKGFAYGVMVASGKPMIEGVNHVFNMNNRAWTDQTKKDGTVEVTFYLFGVREQVQDRCEIELNIKLGDGTWMEPELFDITNKIDKIDKEHFSLEIELGKQKEDTPEDRPIILPEVSSKPDVGVNDWNDTEIGIK